MQYLEVLFFYYSKHQCLISVKGGWLISCQSTSLRTGHKVTTRGCPPVVKENFTVTSKLVQIKQRLQINNIRYCIYIIQRNSFSVRSNTHLHISASGILTKVIIYCKKINNPIHECNAPDLLAIATMTEVHDPAHISSPHTLK